MNTMNKRTIKVPDIKKTIPLTRLIKCYVCSQHFEAQS